MTAKSDKPRFDRESRITIRGLDPNLYRLARIEALKEGRAIGRWLNELIREKLKKK